MAFQRASNSYIKVAVHQCCGLIQQVDKHHTHQKTKHSLLALVWGEVAKFRGDHCTRHLAVPSHTPNYHS